ncbi:MAG TPA: TIR domain-containing protein, partial [Sphingomicrobium sp.]|nr:TIR domain-containing protein [Sphingomicrobium sp.]
MAEVFVSYKAEDRSRVRPLVEALEDDGLSVWWDARVEGGEDWRDLIAQHLDRAQCVIVVWSKRSTAPEGRFVRDEASRAQRRGVYLPVTIDRVEPPLGFGETQALGLSGWKGGRDDPRYRRVLAAAHAVLGREPPAASAAGPRAGVSRRAMLAGGGAAVAAAGAGAWLAFGPSGAKSDSIAVLPFANLSDDPAQEYLADGITEDLTTALSHARWFSVIARNSAFTYKGRA